MSLTERLYVFLFIVFSSSASIASEPVTEQTDAVVAAGRERFVDACAFCHGLSGQGNGMAAGTLEKQPADLTQLRKRNKDAFPLAEVYRVIDGRDSGMSHGERDMPVWGDVWEKNVPEQYTEYYVKGRILELVLYLDSIQE